MAYTVTNWVNENTPVNATNMNKIEAGIADLDETLSAQNLFTAGTALTAGQDLDDITTYGRYNAANSSVSSELKNTPVTGSGFSLFVFPSGGQITQFVVRGVIASSSPTDYLFLRNCNSSGTWSGWFAFAGTLMA